MFPVRKTVLAATVFVVSATLAAPSVVAIDASIELPTNTISILQNRLKSKYFTDATSLTVIDASNGELVFTENADKQLMPASTMKLITAVVALKTLGSSFRFQTKAVWRESDSTLYLVGGGDPQLKTSHLKELAKKVLKNLGKVSATIKIKSDTSYFPEHSLAPGWAANQVPGEVRPLSALAVNDQETKTPAKNAVKLFGTLLSQLGYKTVYKGDGVAAGTQVATVSGYPVSQTIKKMLEDSNNNFAETLFRASTKESGLAATWANSRNHATTVLQSLNLDTSKITLIDGSGLSRQNRMTTSFLTRLLWVARSNGQPELNKLLDNHMLPIGGKSGTLRTRYDDAKTKCARGLVEAKTGGLRDVTSLAGYARSKNGSIAVFAMIVNKVKSRSALTPVRSAIDWTISGLAGC
ncbi:MAG: D-alanyl-D-alanine carboxypeptidase/D-alanyl-D-alanine-endopeptidase [Actinomycetota bacterium]